MADGDVRGGNPPGGRSRWSRRTLIRMGGTAAATLGLSPSGGNAQPGGANTFRFPATGIELSDQSLLLAIDNVSLPLRKNLVLYLSKPQVRAEPVMKPSHNRPDAPDFLAAHFYGTVLHDQGKFRMWYYPCSLGANPDWPAEAKAQLEAYKGNLFRGPYCYAESEDGIVWIKPNLGRVLFKGSRDNNAMAFPDADICGATVIKDENDPDPGRRYKFVYVYYEYPGPGRRGPRRFASLRTAVSPNGIDWEIGPRDQVDDIIEHASFYKHNGLYIVNAQKAGGAYRGDGGHLIGRQGFAWISPDFRRWLPECVDSFALAEPQEVEKRGCNKSYYDQVHLGIGGVSLGNVVVGLYGRWHDRPGREFNQISADLGLVVSSDGLIFQEPVKGYTFLSADESPATPSERGGSHPTVLCQANGILNVGDQTRIYHGRWRNAPDGPDYYGEVALAWLPRDRWGALGLVPDASEGSVWSTPVILPRNGCRLFLNADGAKGLRVEIADERFTPLPGYSGETSGVVTTDGGFDCPVNWARANLGSLGGKTVRIRVQVKKGDHPLPRLYALSLRSGSASGG